MDDNYLKEIKSGYTDNGVAKLSLIDGYPQKLAKEFNEATPMLSTKQSRSIFDTVNGLEVKLRRKSVSFDEVKIELGLLKSRINDKVNKGSIPKVFFEFFEENIKAIKNEKDLQVFKIHLESICNYLKDDKQTGNNGSYNKGTGYNGNYRPRTNGYNNNRR